MTPQSDVRWFKDIRLEDVGLVGGKTASLGELYGALSGSGVLVPNGFALTATAYRDALAEAGAGEALHRLLDDLDKDNMAQLAERAKAAREVVYAATGGAALRAQIIAAYRTLEQEAGRDVAVAVRSSATAEDLPTASFAGQHESYLNIRGEEAVVEACRHCFASIFTDRAIIYRVNNGFDHFKVALSVGVMQHGARRYGRQRRDLHARHRVRLPRRGVHHRRLRSGRERGAGRASIPTSSMSTSRPSGKATAPCSSHTLGRKQLRMVYAAHEAGGGTRNEPTDEPERARFCLDRRRRADPRRPRDDDRGALLGARRPPRADGHRVGEGRRRRPALHRAGAAGDGGVAAGRWRLPDLRPDRHRARPGHRPRRRREDRQRQGARDGQPARAGGLRPGDVLVADTTTPDWEPVMKRAAAIVTNRGGRTCHAAIVARELGVPAVVGAEGATETLRPGATVTVSCADGEAGQVYDGAVPFEVTQVPAADLAHTRTEIMVNLGNPELAFRTAMLPCDGVGLARMEFIVSEYIGVHPMALVHPDKVASAEARAAIARLTAHYTHPTDFFIEKLSEGVGTIAAAFYPRPVIVRLSDFKTNEYASLLGGAAFEPVEANPMLGFRGASRYSHPAYAEGFALECAALRRVREDMGLTNLRVMVPFCRREEEARRVIATMAEHGLKRGENGLEIYVMCEIPNNVIRIDAFAELFDGFSIGSNDLTQLTLGVDRDSAIVAFDFDERDPGMLEMLRLAVTGAKRNHRHVGICGEAPANYPEIASFLAALGIDSISVNPASLPRTLTVVRDVEQRQG